MLAIKQLLPNVPYSDVHSGSPPDHCAEETIHTNKYMELILMYMFFLVRISATGPPTEVIAGVVGAVGVVVILLVVLVAAVVFVRKYKRRTKRYTGILVYNNVNHEYATVLVREDIIYEVVASDEQHRPSHEHMFAEYDTVQQTTPPGVNTTDVGQLSTGYNMLESVSISELDSIDTRSSGGTRQGTWLQTAQAGVEATDPQPTTTEYEETDFVHTNSMAEGRQRTEDDIELNGPPAQTGNAVYANVLTEDVLVLSTQHAAVDLNHKKKKLN